MSARALLLIGAMLVCPAWAQEPTFDLNSDSIRKIVRATAATQSVPIQLSAEPVAHREPAAILEYVPPIEAAPVKHTAPPRGPPPPPPQSDGFVSFLFNTLVDTLLDAATGESARTQGVVWRACESAGGSKTFTQPAVMCASEGRQVIDASPTLVPLQR